MKKINSIKLILSFAFFCLVFNAAIANDGEKKTIESNNRALLLTDPTIIEVASENENFSTLIAVVKTAGLIGILNSNGPFTVFAPVNAAFEKLPEGVVPGLLEPKAKNALTAVLTYHVVSSKIMTRDLKETIRNNGGQFEIKTIQGGILTASLKGDYVILTDVHGNISKIIITDVAASNGVIHAIDSVVMPI